MRLLLGLIKGIVIGGLVGLGAYSLGLGGAFHWLTYGLVGFMVGLLVGRPIWSHLVDKHSTVVVAVLKGIVGYGVGVGVYALVAKVWGGGDPIAIADYGARRIQDWQPLFGAIVGGVYGIWVELDDAPEPGAAKQPGAAKPEAGKKKA